MYRAAILTDVHGNLPALESVLNDLNGADIDAIYHLGDAISIGPFPREVLELLLGQSGTHFVLGNHDDYFAFGIPAAIADDPRRHETWTHAQLPETLRPTMQEWPRKQSLSVAGLEVRFLHYALSNDETALKPVIKEPTPDQLGPLFAIGDADLIWYGHHHPQADASADGIRYVNPGALGCSYDNLARYAILKISPDGRYEIDFRAVEYDRASLLHAFDARDVPVRDFITRTFFGVPDPNLPK